jgi:hypothetical protein
VAFARQRQTLEPQQTQNAAENNSEKHEPFPVSFSGVLVCCGFSVIAVWIPRESSELARRR